MFKHTAMVPSQLSLKQEQMIQKQIIVSFIAGLTDLPGDILISVKPAQNYIQVSRIIPVWELFILIIPILFIFPPHTVQLTAHFLECTKYLKGPLQIMALHGHGYQLLKILYGIIFAL